MRIGFCLSLVLALGLLTWAMDDQVPEPTGKSSLVGYVDCSGRDKVKIVPTYFDACERVPFAGLACGRKVTVLERNGPWLKVGVANESPRYIIATAVSQRADKFVPVDVDSGIADIRPPNCTAERRDLGPRAIYAPDPEYTEYARKMKITGTVVLSLTVGTDGLPHDIQVEKKLVTVWTRRR